MRTVGITLIIWALCISLTPSLAQTKHPLQVTGAIILTNNGIDPVPAFALGKPALMSTLELTKKNFTYISQLNISITDFKPWSQNNWFLLKIPVSAKGFFRTGLAFSYFHKRDVLDFPQRTQVETQLLNQYLAMELSYTHKFSDHFQLSLTNWLARGIEWDAVRRGSFTNLGAYLSGLEMGSVQLSLSPNVFYTQNAGPFKGWFTSMSMWLFYGDLPVGLTGQIVQPLYTDPKTGGNWNIGLMYKF